MKKRISAFSLSMLLTGLLAAGFTNSFDAVISVSIFLALSITLADIIRPGNCLKTFSVFFSVFSIIYALITPHFNAFEEVYGLALSSDRIMDTDPGSIFILYGTSLLIIAVGITIKFILIKKTHKKIKTGGI
jgi:hypothetical protein